MCYFCAPKRGFLGHFRGVPFVGPPGPERLTNFFCYLGSKECHRLSETYAEYVPGKNVHGSLPINIYFIRYELQYSK